MVTVTSKLNHLEDLDKQFRAYGFYVLTNNEDYRSWRVGDILFVGNDPRENFQLFNLRMQGWMYDSIKLRNCRLLKTGESFTVTI